MSGREPAKSADECSHGLFAYCPFGCAIPPTTARVALTHRAGGQVMDSDIMHKMGEAIRREMKTLAIDWFGDDLKSPDDGPRELTPWNLLAIAAYEAEHDGR
jgi:hypothetical protein